MPGPHVCSDTVPFSVIKPVPYESIIHSPWVQAGLGANWTGRRSPAGRDCLLCL